MTEESCQGPKNRQGLEHRADKERQRQLGLVCVAKRRPRGIGQHPQLPEEQSEPNLPQQCQQGSVAQATVISVPWEVHVGDWDNLLAVEAGAVWDRLHSGGGVPILGG